VDSEHLVGAEFLVHNKIALVCGKALIVP
jgi:hypothetical protein